MSLPPTPSFSPSPGKGRLRRPDSLASLRPATRSNSRLSLVSKSAGMWEDDTPTAVRVAIRVRPPLQPSDPGYDLIPQRFQRSTCEVTTPANLTIQSPQGNKLFVFDRVFDENVSQQGVWEYINESVDSFIHGYNVSILAYGQSGAGKSYTMGTSGPDQRTDDSVRGIVPRAAAAVFHKLANVPASRSGLRSPKTYSMQGLPTVSSMPKLASAADKDWHLTATYVEIYNEQFRDLLAQDTLSPSDRPQVAVREDRKGRISLTGLTECDINSVEDLLNALHSGSSIRQTDATSINAQSSRSHAIFTLNLRKSSGNKNADNRRSLSIDPAAQVDEPVTTTSKLHFVDLAGSERLKNTGAQGDRAKEGISINAGLASLGKVISQLSSKSHGAHISYRDSKLTRLLQDSLGGTAITYMVACVNPAEFHLSETLNTLTYAQRARAIQSKPEIQQAPSEADKNALIAKLKIEIAFLRGQVTNDKSDQRLPTPLNGSGSRVHQLESQLMDAQETYQALNQRHEKLIAELGRSAEANTSQSLEGPEDQSAVDRLQRSSSFAEAVESVIAEYEKTIQSLESSLIHTRSSLSKTEVALQEHESTISHLEAAAQQDQGRIRKLQDKEAHTEQYMQQLESQLVGVVSNEESTATLVQGLHTELNRTKQSQTSTEEYTATLERRLAEAEENHIGLKRELDRLESVIDRQRSLAQPAVNGVSIDDFPKTPTPMRILTNGFCDESLTLPHSPPSPLSETADVGSHQSTRSISPLHEHELDQSSAAKDVSSTPTQASHSLTDITRDAQSQFMADKVETLTQELFDLRGEHETSINDYDELRRKYAIALQSLAKMTEDEGKSRELDAALAPPRRSDSFLGETLPVGQARGTIGRSVRSSSVGCSSPSRSVRSQTPTRSIPEQSSNSLNGPSDLAQMSSPQEGDKAAANEGPSATRETELSQLQDDHEKLLVAHREVLDEVENLKVEMKRLRFFNAPSPLKTQLVRRKTSQDISSSLKNYDKANRSFASLRNIALDHFESQPDIRQNFELQLNTIMSELHAKTELAQSGEAEAAALRKQLDEKALMISGLSRERSTLKSRSSVDFSAVSAMRQQLLFSEQQIKMLQQAQATREAKLQTEIEALKTELKQHDEQSKVGADGSAGEDVRSLQAQLSTWETKHNTAMEEMHASELKLLATIAMLEASLTTAEAGTQLDPNTPSGTGDALRSQAEELSRLQSLHANVSHNLEQKNADHETTIAELDEHRNLVKDLQHQVESQQAVEDNHTATLAKLKDSYATELDDLRRGQQQSLDRAAEIQEEHEDALDGLEKEIREHQATSLGLLAGLATILGRPVDYSNFEAQVKDLVVSKRDLERKHNQVQIYRTELENQLEEAETEKGFLQGKLNELQATHHGILQQVEEVTQKELRSSRLVQELEDQLTANYDNNHKTTKRLSQDQSAKHLQLQEALHSRTELEKDLEDAKARILLLENRLGEVKHRSSSTNGHYRESLSAEAATVALARSTSPTKDMRRTSPSMDTTALPSPPPTMPLPPLPKSSANSGQGFFDYRGLQAAPFSSRPQSPQMNPMNPMSRMITPSATPDPATMRRLEDTEARVRTVEKHLFAEKQLTATLEEALVDLETAQNKTRQDVDAWRAKALRLEDELLDLRRERDGSRASMQTVEAERELRLRAEQARRNMEEHMRALEAGKRKKRNALNCF